MSLVMPINTNHWKISRSQNAADKVAGDVHSDVEELGIIVISSDIFARNVLPDIPCTNSWYWGDAAGTPLPLVPI